MTITSTHKWIHLNSNCLRFSAGIRVSAWLLMRGYSMSGSYKEISTKSGAEPSLQPRRHQTVRPAQTNKLTAILVRIWYLHTSKLLYLISCHFLNSFVIAASWHLMCFVSTAQQRRSARKETAATSWRETVQKPEQRWLPQSVCVPLGPRQKRRCVKAKASCPQIPSNRNAAEKGPYTSSSNLKRKMTQRGKIFRSHLRICHLLSNKRR